MNPKKLTALKKRLIKWQNRFTVLSNWDLHISLSKEFYAAVTTHPTKPLATFFPWPNSSSEPDDFMLHEFLHSALRAWERLPKNLRRKEEEQLVREICWIYENKK